MPSQEQSPDGAVESAYNATVASVALVDEEVEEVEEEGKDQVKKQASEKTVLPGKDHRGCKAPLSRLAQSCCGKLRSLCNWTAGCQPPPQQQQQQAQDRKSTRLNSSHSSVSRMPSSA